MSKSIFVAQQLYWNQKENYFSCVLENTHKVGESYNHYSVIQGNLWINCLFVSSFYRRSIKRKKNAIPELICYFF